MRHVAILCTAVDFSTLGLECLWIAKKFGETSSRFRDLVTSVRVVLRRRKINGLVYYRSCVGVGGC